MFNFHYSILHGVFLLFFKMFRFEMLHKKSYNITKIVNAKKHFKKTLDISQSLGYSVSTRA